MGHTDGRTNKQMDGRTDWQKTVVSSGETDKGLKSSTDLSSLSKLQVFKPQLKLTRIID